jgi:hypothetical protein
MNACHANPRSYRSLAASTLKERSGSLEPRDEEDEMEQWRRGE